jgi:hypothetical protein
MCAMNASVAGESCDARNACISASSLPSRVARSRVRRAERARPRGRRERRRERSMLRGHGSGGGDVTGKFGSWILRVWLLSRGTSIHRSTSSSCIEPLGDALFTAHISSQTCSKAR